MSESLNPAIELCGLTKDYVVGLRGVRLRAVDHLSLRISSGQIYGLLGPNGSGKSTTIKIILGLVQPTQGASLVFGVPSHRVEARSDVGYLPESPQFPRYLTGRELVSFYGRLCGLRRSNLDRRVAEVIAHVGLSAAADRRIETYSKGMLQRIGLAQAIVHEPKLIILDEPTAGVDPAGVAAMTDLILQLKAQGKTVVLTSHVLEQIETVCDRVALLERGRLLVEGAVGELVQSIDREIVDLDTLPHADRIDLRSWLAARGRTSETITRPRHRLDQVFLEWLESEKTVATN